MATKISLVTEGTLFQVYEYLKIPKHFQFLVKSSIYNAKQNTYFVSVS